ncbi:MAG TPA: transposase [Mycobacterium sp.]
MAKGFRPVDRGQRFLVPPDMREWLPADHLVWFVLDAVAGLDLAGFRAGRRLGGAGRAAYDPGMLLALLIYAYAVGQRSSRQIERLCQTDVAFRIVCAQDAPDHATIARFRAEQERALDGLFTQVLMVCARAGMGRVGAIAIDGTKIAADAALAANRSESRLRRVAADILAEAAAVDAAEDEQYGDRRGDELPPQLADPDGRAARIKAMLDDIAAERAAKIADSEPVRRAAERVEHAQQRLARTRATVAERNTERARWEQIIRADGGMGIGGNRPVPVDEHYDVRQVAARLARAEENLTRARQAAGSSGDVKRNLTDPDSRIMPTRHGWVQGYNCQLVVSSDYLILAADVATNPTDYPHYPPMIDQAGQAARAIRRATGRRTRIGTVLADAGYASTTNLTCPGPDRLIALGTRHDHHIAARDHPTHGGPPAHATAWQRMNHRLRTPAGATRYKRRAALVEPVHAHLKDRRALRRFTRRGLTAARSEYRFAAAVTNLLRLHTHLAANPT